jgi:hypothetical protein
VIEVPVAEAVPCEACVAIATDEAAPPVRLSVIGFALLPWFTVALTGLATGGGTF